MNFNTYGNPENTLGTLNGLFKQVYADNVENLIPDGVKAYNLIKFAKSDKLGNAFNLPVVLQLEHGITFAGPDDDNFDLNPAVAGATKNAQVKGNPKILRAGLGMVAISRSAGGDRQAFVTATKFLVENSLRSMTKALEAEMIYGQIGLGTVGSVSTTTVTVATAEWASGIWVGGTGMKVEIRSADGATSRGEYTLTRVANATRQLVFSTNVASDGVVAGDVLWRKGAYGKEFVGIHRVLTQAAGDLFGISTSAYDLWRGNEFDCGGADLTFEKLVKAATLAIDKGQEGKLVAMISHKTFPKLLTEQMALRRFDSSWEKTVVQTGAEKLTFFSQSGEIEIVASTYVKEGYAYLLSVEDWMRVGSSELTFKVPGAPEEEMIRQAENSAGYEYRLFCDQALFCQAPGRSVLLKNIVNS